jgi:hypothetical protein
VDPDEQLKNALQLKDALVLRVSGIEEKVVPLVDNFDIAPFLDTIIEKLGGMDDELRAELKRVNDAYRKLLAALPDGANQGASVSVSVAA